MEASLMTTWGSEHEFGTQTATWVVPAPGEKARAGRGSKPWSYGLLAALDTVIALSHSNVVNHKGEHLSPAPMITGNVECNLKRGCP